MHLKLYTVVSLVGIVQHWDLLHNIELEEICSVCMLPSAFWNITLNIKRALVLFFLALANPILCSTSAFLSFNIPTLSTLWRKKTFFYIFFIEHIDIHVQVSYVSNCLNCPLCTLIDVSSVYTYDTLMSVADFILISITVVPSMSLSRHGVEFFPHTLQAW